MALDRRGAPELLDGGMKRASSLASPSSGELHRQTPVSNGLARHSFCGADGLSARTFTSGGLGPRAARPSCHHRLCDAPSATNVAPCAARSSTAPSSGIANSSSGSWSTTSTTTTSTGPTGHSTNTRHRAPRRLRSDRPPTRPTFIESADATGSSASTGTQPDQARPSFRHPHPVLCRTACVATGWPDL